MLWIWVVIALWVLIGHAFIPGAKVRFEKRDVWLGAYFGPNHTYVCFIPFVVFIIPNPEWKRRRAV